MNILVVEDDRNIASSLEGVLQREGWTVRLARDAGTGEAIFDSFKPDLVILDWMLPDRDGLEVLKAIRRRGSTPVLFLTARDDIADKVLGLELGADDYLTKPFHIRELVARVRTLLRRCQQPAPALSTLRYGPIEMEVETRRVTREGVPLELTRTEFDLLLHFVRNPRIVISRENLLDAVWGYNFEGYQRTVDAHIHRLRSKLEPAPESPRFIHSVRGVGYRLELEPEGD
jgi:DNA-binding response OmpR family regulator